MAAQIDLSKLTLAPEDQVRLFREYEGELRRYFQGQPRRNAVEGVDDLMQLTFVVLRRSRPAEPIRDPKAYLWGIARHVLQHSDRRLKRQRQHFVPLQELPDPAESSFEGAEEQSGSLPVLEVAWEADPTNTEILQAQIIAALGALPPMWQATFVLAYRELLTYREIGQRLSISEHTVKKYLKQTLAHLRSHMNANTKERWAERDRS